MNVLVMGAGAIGSLFGGLLSLAGHPVTLVGRPANVAAVRSHGLIITHREGTLTAKLECAAGPQELAGGKFDLLLLAVKGYDTSRAVADIQSLLDHETMIMSLQNGLGIEHQIFNIIGRREVMRGLTACGACIVRPGEISFNGVGETVVGSTSQTLTPSVEAVAGILREAGVPTRTTENLTGAVWTKTLANAAINPLGTLTGLTNGELVDSPGLRSVMIQVVEEGMGVARAAGVKFDVDPVDATVNTAKATSTNINSMLQDIRRRRRTEIDYINGAIAERGKELGVPTPLNHALAQLIKGLETRMLAE